MTCPGCNKRINMKDFDTKNILHNGEQWHRICAMKDGSEYSDILALFQSQDDWDCDATTAFADLIGQLGHFCDAHNKGKRKNKINFEDAIRRGVRYWENER